jgi:hypothetical protein
MKYRTALLLILNYLFALISIRPVHAAQERAGGASLIAELSTPSLVDENHQALLDAFDIAPDGSILAVLYEAWKKPPAPNEIMLWLATWNVRSHTLVRRIGIAPVAISPDALSATAYLGDTRKLAFSPDQSHLIVCALGTIWNLALRPEAELAPVEPPDPKLRKPVAIQAFSNATVALTYRTGQENLYYTALFDASSGANLRGFTSSAIPQSFSPDGKLAVALAPGESNSGGVAGLQVIDVGTGAKLRSVSVGFGFKKRYRNEGGEVLPRFLDNARIVVAPDNTIDHTGNHSGYSLEIIDVSRAQVVGEFTPRHFVPSGGLAISADRNRFVASSNYLTPWEYRSEVPLLPGHPKQEIFVFAKDNPKPEAVIGGLSPSLPRQTNEAIHLSSDGSVIAVALYDSIKVFEIRK